MVLGRLGQKELVTVLAHTGDHSVKAFMLTLLVSY
jgi:hypothetical protein